MAAGACALVLGARGVAHAHAALVSAEPAAGSRLASGPARVRLVFSEPVEPALARLALAAAGGGVTRLAAAGDPRDVYAVVAPVSVLGPGAYRLLWRVVSVDGHAVEGSVAFSVGSPGSSTTRASTAPVQTAAPQVAAPQVAAPPATPATPVWDPAAAGAPLVPAALRGLALGDLLALAGVLGFLALPRVPDAPAPRRAARLAGALAAAAPVLLALHLAAWLANLASDQRLTAEWASAALAGGAGRVELWRTGLALLALWAAALARRPRLALVFAVGAVLASGATGHAAAIRPLWAIPAKAAHLLAAAAWLGGLLWLVARERTDARAFAREAGRVSAVALPAALVVALTGALQTALFLPAPLALVRSAYGALVLLKVAGLLALVAFGAYHRSRVLPRLALAPATPGRFGTTLRREVAVMSLVVLVSGLLAYVPPPTQADVAASSSHAPPP